MSEAFRIELQQFIDQNIESLAQLETLLLLQGEQQRLWSADAVAKSLYISRDMAAALLADLSRRGFAESAGDVGGEYRFQAASDETRQLVKQLAEVYEERRVAVITQIYSKPVNKVQTFADAFRLRREE